MSCISIVCFGHIANKFNVILSILKEAFIFPEKGDLFRIGKTNMNTLRAKYDFFPSYNFHMKAKSWQPMLKSGSARFTFIWKL